MDGRKYKGSSSDAYSIRNNTVRILKKVYFTDQIKTLINLSLKKL